MQKAQPVLLGHHLLAYAWMLKRDLERFKESLKRINQCPLGACAIAGSSLPIDREFTARQLGFEGVIPNSMDAVSDRDFVLDVLYAGSVVMMHLSRLCEELMYGQQMSSRELPARCCISSTPLTHWRARAWVPLGCSSPLDLYSQWAAMPLLAISSIPGCGSGSRSAPHAYRTAWYAATDSRWPWEWRCSP